MAFNVTALETLLVDVRNADSVGLDMCCSGIIALVATTARLALHGDCMSPVDHCCEKCHLQYPEP